MDADGLCSLGRVSQRAAHLQSLGRVSRFWSFLGMLGAVCARSDTYLVSRPWGFSIRYCGEILMYEVERCLTAARCQEYRCCLDAAEAHAQVDN